MKSKAPLLLMEQMVMLLVFALAAALCLQAFVKSDGLTRRSEARDRAMTLCQSAAEAIRQSGDVETGLTLACGTVPKQRDGFGFFVSYDENWEVLADEARSGSYTLRAMELDSDVAGLGKANVEAFRWNAGTMESIFVIEVAWQEGTFVEVDDGTA